jgi:hypothetical protein
MRMPELDPLIDELCDADVADLSATLQRIVAKGVSPIQERRLREVVEARYVQTLMMSYLQELEDSISRHITDPGYFRDLSELELSRLGELASFRCASLSSAERVEELSLALSVEGDLADLHEMVRGSLGRLRHWALDLAAEIGRRNTTTLRAAGKSTAELVHQLNV